jgi:hypothetical protein
MITLYQGGFLDGVTINDVAEFETWVAMSREHFNEAHACMGDRASALRCCPR